MGALEDGADVHIVIGVVSEEGIARSAWLCAAAVAANGVQKGWMRAAKTGAWVCIAASRIGIGCRGAVPMAADGRR